MKLRIKKKHLKQKEKLFMMLKKDGYEVNDNPTFFNAKLRLGLGELIVMDLNGETHLCRYGYNNDHILSFVEESDKNIYYLPSEVLGFKKAQHIEKKTPKIVGIQFNIIDEVISNKENEIKNENDEVLNIMIHQCKITDNGELIFGFFDKNDKINSEGKYLGPDWFNPELSYKEAIEEEFKKLIDNDESDYVDAIKNTLVKNGFSFERIPKNTRYANKLEIPKI